jgi:hypothetical protein
VSVLALLPRRGGPLWPPLIGPTVIGSTIIGSTVNASTIGVSAIGGPPLIGGSPIAHRRAGPATG